MSKTSAWPSVTIRHVAARAGVSIKTVSRVLNREPGVIPETQALVRAAVAELNYSPNLAARNLASVVPNTIGLAYSHLSFGDDRRGGYQYSMILQIGALEACRRHEFGLIPIPCDTRQEDLTERLIAQARERRLGGLVIAAPLGNTPGMLDELTRQGIPHVCINPNDLGQAAPYVAIDELGAAYEMTSHLIGHGHTRIGFIKGFRGSRVSEERYQGFCKAMAEHALKVDRRWICQGEFTFSSGVKCAKKLLALTPRVTAIFASNDDMAVGVMHAAHAGEIHIPNQVSVVGFDDTELARYSWPPLTTIRQPLEQMADVAVGQLVALIRPQRVGVTPPAPRVLFSCELIPRNSVARIT